MRSTPQHPGPRHLALAAVTALTLGGAVLTGLPAAAQPHAHHAIDSRADSTGPIVTDSHGTGYVAWNEHVKGPNGDPVVFCTIPRGGTCTKKLTLPLPAHAHWDNYQLIQPFPVLGGKANTVLVVDPSYVQNTVLVWTSHNHGGSFTGPQVIPSPTYANNTSVDDVLLSPGNPSPSLNYFSIASHNTGLGYTFTGTGAIGAMDPPEGFKFDTDAISGAVAGGTLGFSGQQTIEAFWTDANHPRLAYFWAPLPGVSGSPGTLEHGPTQVAIGSNARLAGGPKGLFLLSEDAGSKPSKPLRLDVRAWKRHSHTFGAPTVVGTVPSRTTDSTLQGGFTEDTSSGDLVVAWPGSGPHGQEVMHLWTSKDRGKKFGKPTTVANIGGGYVGPTRLAASGRDGFLTFQDDSGLRLVDLTHL